MRATPQPLGGSTMPWRSIRLACLSLLCALVGLLTGAVLILGNRKPNKQ